MPMIQWEEETVAKAIAVARCKRFNLMVVQEELLALFHLELVVVVGCRVFTAGSHTIWYVFPIDLIVGWKTKRIKCSICSFISFRNGLDCTFGLMAKLKRHKLIIIMPTTTAPDLLFCEQNGWIFFRNTTVVWCTLKTSQNWKDYSV